MIGKVIKYLMKGPRRRNQIPLLPRKYTSQVGKAIPVGLEFPIDQILGQAAARSKFDAVHLIKNDLSTREIIAQNKREHRRFGRFYLFKRRLHKMLTR